MIPFATPRFEQPPAHIGTRTDWRAVAEILAERPGEWAALGTCRHNYGMDRRRLASYGLEARRRQDADGTCIVWARWVGVTAACSPCTAPVLASQQPPAPVVPLVSTRRRRTRWSWGQVVAA